LKKCIGKNKNQKCNHRHTKCQLIASPCTT
jgi:hypothetical protein